jgi:hypothetical protein
MIGPTRRSALAGVAASLASLPAAADAPHPLKGRKIYSESVQIACGDPGGRRFAVLRLCQYPEAGVAWLWAAAVIDGRLALAVDNEAVWSGSPSVREGAEAASYAAATRTANFAFSRTGPRDQPVAAEAQFVGTHGRGRFAVSAQFRPATGFSGLLPGRSEQFGRVRAEVELGGRTVVIDGPGQWHEQPQTDPRFVTPFVYASLWGRDTFSTLLQSPEGSGGYIIRPGGVTRFDRVAFGRPGGTRPVRATGPNGAAAQMLLEEVRAYDFGVYDEIWRGAFVRTRLDGVPLIGFANTFPTGYRPE